MRFFRYNSRNIRIRKRRFIHNVPIDNIAGRLSHKTAYKH